MFRIRKAKIKHKCLICDKEIKPKSHYINFNKQNIDGTYKTGAICEACAEEIFISAIEVISCFKMRKSLLNKLSTHKKQGTSGHLQWLLIAIIGICVIIVIPCLVATLTKFVGANSTWIDFWGGYLGAILGGNTSPLSSLCTIINAPIILVETPQDV